MTQTTEALIAVSIHPLLRDAGLVLTTGTSVLFAHLPTPGGRADYQYYKAAGPGTDPVPANHSRCPSPPPLSRRPVSNAQHVPFLAPDTDTHPRWTPTDCPQHDRHPSNATRQPPHDCASRNPAHLGRFLLLLVRRFDSQPGCAAIAEPSPVRFPFSPPPYHDYSGPDAFSPSRRVTQRRVATHHAAAPDLQSLRQPTSRVLTTPPQPDAKYSALPFTSSPPTLTALCTGRRGSSIRR